MTGDGRHCAGELGTGSRQEEVASFWVQVIGQGSVIDKNKLVCLSLATRLQIPHDKLWYEGLKGDGGWRGAGGEDADAEGGAGTEQL